MTTDRLSIRRHPRVGPFAAPQKQRANFCQINRCKARVDWRHYGRDAVLDLQADERHHHLVRPEPLAFDVCSSSPRFPTQFETKDHKNHGKQRVRS